MDFIPPGGDNSFVVIICALRLSGVDITTNVTEEVVTNHQCLPASWYKGVLPYGKLSMY